MIRAPRFGALGMLVVLGVLPWAVQPTAAHQFDITDAIVVLKSNGTYSVELTVDLDALALGLPQETDSALVVAELETLSAAEFESALERLRDLLARRTRIRFDQEKQRPLVAFPELENPLDVYDVPTILGTTAQLTGIIPENAEVLTFGASRAFQTVNVTILEQSTLNGMRQLLQPGADSDPYRIGQPASGDQQRVAVIDYLMLGFVHIIPRGLDHILFVLGLFLLSGKLRPLLWQVTAFTIAHSITLALSLYDIVSLPARIVEPLIALSIAYVAIENMLTERMQPWRPLIVFGFGLLHGLGFAGVLRELGLPEGQFLAALLTFNVGVELGQLAVLGLAFLVLGPFLARPWYRHRVAIPISAAIALLGIYWAIQRGLGG